MERHARRRQIISNILDALATRLGFSLSLIGLVVLCILAGVYVERSVRQLELNQEVFDDREIRNGFVSMSDLQRLVLIAQDVVASGQLTAQRRQAFVEATDIIFVRKEFFRNSIRSGLVLDTAVEAVEGLENVLEIAERAIASDFDDIQGLWAELLPASDEARRALVLFQEDMTRFQNELMRAQAQAVRQQRIVVLTALVGISVVGAAAFMLLRREVLTRMAQERAERHVEFLAYFDQLTKLPNRTQFQKRLETYLKRSEPIALVLVDLDEFKGINDTYGHAAGDAVLCHTATLLARLSERWNGFAARLGGDEFAMVLETDDLDGVAASCRQLLQEARKGLSYEGEMFQIGLSIGFVTSNLLGQDFPTTVDSMCRVADFALYSSKTNGRGRFTKYDQVLEEQYFERRAMVDILPQVIAKGELDIFLQPKVRLPGQEIYGFEALVRWRRNGRIVPPEDFIRIAEESGLIFELDKYVLEVAIREIGDYNSQQRASISVSVNLSALHFNSRRILRWVQDALDASALSPDLLTLEITETTELRDWEEARRIMSDLRRIGVKISIDDFGTGYSSLSYLRSAIVDEVKIDRSVVDQIAISNEARFLLDGILDIAGNLGLGVVVEGVETMEQATILYEMGADRAQGYLFGKPVPVRDAINALGGKVQRRNGTRAGIAASKKRRHNRG